VFTGVGVALVTLFDDAGRLDAPATGAFAARLVDAGVRAVVVAGTTGEAAKLDGPERVKLLAAVREALPAGVPVIAGTGATTTPQAAAYTADAVAQGADAVLTLSLPGTADHRHYYQEVAAAAAGAPVLAYHYPAVSDPGIPVERLGSLPVDGLKDSSGDPERLLRELTGWDRPVYTGSSALLSFAGPLGAAGAILALANLEPERCIRAFAGDVDAQRALVPSQVAHKADFPAGLKRLLAERFGTSPVVRR
jgi:4-hydroxy-tetrahydrodipicolinate synthase